MGHLADAPEDSTDNIGHRVDQEMIGAKYYQDETTRTALQATQIIAMYSNSRISSEVHAAIKKKQEEARKQTLESADERREKILASDLADRL